MLLVRSFRLTLNDPRICTWSLFALLTNKKSEIN